MSPNKIRTTDKLKTTPANRKPKLNLPIRVVLAHEDVATYRAATGIYRGVVQRLAPDFKFRASWLRFDTLAEPASLESAIDLAAEADLVFICLSNPHRLPRPVLDWLGQWLTRRNQSDGALEMILPAMTGNSFPHQTLLEKDLRETARVNGLSFFSTKYAPDNSKAPSPDATQAPVVFQENPAAVHAVDHRTDVSYWRTNE